MILIISTVDWTPWFSSEKLSHSMSATATRMPAIPGGSVIIIIMMGDLQ